MITLSKYKHSPICLLQNLAMSLYCLRGENVCHTNPYFLSDVLLWRSYPQASTLQVIPNYLGYRNCTLPCARLMPLTLATPFAWNTLTLTCLFVSSFQTQLFSCSPPNCPELSPIPVSKTADSLGGLSELSSHSSTLPRLCSNDLLACQLLSSCASS